MLSVPYEELKLWSEYKGNLPKYSSRQVTTAPSPLSCWVSSARLKCFPHPSSVHNRIVMASSHCYSLCTRIVCDLRTHLPLGSSSYFRSRIRSPRWPRSKAMHLLQYCLGRSSFTWIRPKPSATANESEWAPSTLLSGYFWVVATPDAADANMEVNMEQGGYIKVEVLENKKNHQMMY